MTRPTWRDRGDEMKIRPKPGQVTLEDVERPIPLNQITWSYHHPPTNLWQVQVGWAVIEGTRGELKSFFEAGHDMMARFDEQGNEVPVEGIVRNVLQKAIEEPTGMNEAFAQRFPSCCIHCGVVGGGHTQTCIVGGH